MKKNRSGYYLLSAGTDAKTVKGEKRGYHTGILYMAPARVVEGINVCLLAQLAGCEDACLYTAGMGVFDNVQEARIRRTMLWRDDKDQFLDYLASDIRRHEQRCEAKGMIPCVRPNGTSDVPWHRYLDMESFNLQFYDYTKEITRMQEDLPSNYHLTASYSEASAEYMQYLNTYLPEDGNLAVVFGRGLPKTFLGRPVIDADQDDLRFLDPPGVVPGLSAKGQARKDTSGFVVHNYQEAA